MKRYSNLRAISAELVELLGTVTEPVRVPGHPEYQLTEPQRAVVLVLVRAKTESKSPDVDQIFLLSQSGQAANRLEEVFRDSPAWGSLVVPGKRAGSYRIGPTK